MKRTQGARTVRVRRAKNGRRGHLRHLYSNPAQRAANERAFVRRYGQRGGRDRRGGAYIFGATVGKVRREQRAARRRR